MITRRFYLYQSYLTFKNLIKECNQRSVRYVVSSIRKGDCEVTANEMLVRAYWWEGDKHLNTLSVSTDKLLTDQCSICNVHRMYCT